MSEIKSVSEKAIRKVLNQVKERNHLITDKLSDTSTIFVQNKSVDANANGLKMLLRIYSENASTDKKIRSIFLGGTIEDKGQEIIVSPLTRLTENDRLLKIGQMLEEQLMEKISEEV